MKGILQGIFALVALVGCCRSALPTEQEVKDALTEAKTVTQLKSELDVLERDLNTRVPAQCPLSLVHGKREFGDADMDRTVNNALLATRILMKDSKHTLEEVNNAHVREILKRDNGDPCPVLIGKEDCDFSDPYRKFDGSCNNEEHPEWGMAGISQQRLRRNFYDDGLGTPRGSRNNDLPKPRDLSNKIHRNEDPKKEVRSDHLTLHAMGFGQFLDHDVTQTPEIEIEDCCADEFKDDIDQCFNMIFEKDDEFQKIFEAGYCMEFKRSAPLLCEDDFSDGKAVRQQNNVITAFVDGSNVYGSSVERAKLLRDKETSYLLKETRVNGNKRIPNAEDDESCTITKSDQHCSVAGDIRVNEVPCLTSYHYLLLKEHNRIANFLKDFYDTDEEIFQETRKLVGAILQKISYDEFLEAILSKDTLDTYDLLSSAPYKYQEDVNPTMLNEFSTAAFRVGHTWVSRRMVYFNKMLEEKNGFPTEDTFHNPDMTYPRKAFEELSYWLAGAQSFATDGILEEAIRNALFIDRKLSKAFDLAALNIQRGRDHGLAPYHVYRKLCKLEPVEDSWDPESGNPPLPGHSPEMTKKLRDAGYDNPEVIDLFVGGLTENPAKGGDMGPTFECIIGKMFHRLKFGDRFWFQNDQFTPAQEEAIRKYTFANMLCNNYKYREIQYPNAFKWNDPLTRCNNKAIKESDLDLDLFKPASEEKKDMNLDERLEQLIEALEEDKKTEN